MELPVAIVLSELRTYGGLIEHSHLRPFPNAFSLEGEARAVPRMGHSIASEWSRGNRGATAARATPYQTNDAVQRDANKQCDQKQLSGGMVRNHFGTQAATASRLYPWKLSSSHLALSGHSSQALGPRQSLFPVKSPTLARELAILEKERNW